MKNKITCILLGHSWVVKSFWNAARGDPNGIYQQCSGCNKVRRLKTKKSLFIRKKQYHLH